MARPGRPTLAPDKAERVRDGMRKARAAGKSTELAVALGVSPSAVSQILSGKNAPSYQTAEAVARMLDITVAELLGEEAASTEAPSPRDAAIQWARAAGYPDAVISRATRARKGPPLSYDAWMDRLRAWRSEFDAGIIEEPGEPPAPEDLSEPRRKR